MLTSMEKPYVICREVKIGRSEILLHVGYTGRRRIESRVGGAHPLLSGRP